MGRPWKELEAEGVKRCSCYFGGGKRCCSRAMPGSSFCAKHAPIFDRLKKDTKRMLESMKKEESK